MIASCLVKDPSKRPSAKKLLKHSFFKQARSNDYIARTLLEGLPALGDRLQALKRKEEDMLAQKKMPDGQKEEISQNEYKRGISSWNFNLDDMKAQASLIQDDDAIAEKDEDIQSKQLQHQPSFSKNKVLQHQLSFASQYSDVADSDDTLASISSVDSTTNIPKCEKSDDDASVPGSNLEQPTTNTSLGNDNHAESSLMEKPASEVIRKSSNGASTISNQSEKVQNQSQNLSHAGFDNLQLTDNAQPEIIPKGSKTSVNGDEVDEKAKNPVVQQKGRFKVTSENIETEKVVPPLTLQKSHSVQVIAQLPAVSSPLASDAAPPNPSGHSLLPILQTILQTNILQRDGILNAMKQLAAGDSSDLGCAAINTTMTPITAMMEKSLLEGAPEREKMLLREIADLKLRLETAQGELQKYKTENARVDS
ncbi:Non-specific serine/threonine protein kinase [Handroanthus impetiginosus]|uniref:Non-specific serine/threonine protein kinase n=1 Tax=Handroanthus impetiginosus TaxID=429701 RepID=A0A2G9H300_9LAMI|nr:Non-specific serine/threonine protein kinase [Handroanthus impetiginosus]